MGLRLLPVAAAAGPVTVPRAQVAAVLPPGPGVRPRPESAGGGGGREAAGRGAGEDGRLFGPRDAFRGRPARLSPASSGGGPRGAGVGVKAGVWGVRGGGNRGAVEGTVASLRRGLLKINLPLITPLVKTLSLFSFFSSPPLHITTPFVLLHRDLKGKEIKVSLAVCYLTHPCWFDVTL